MRAIARAPFAGMRMDEIGPADCRESLAWIKANPQRPNLVREEGLSNTTMRGIYRFVRQTFGQAVDDELLARNPMAKVKDPRDDSPEVEALPWRELERILDLLDKQPMSGYVMALYLIVCDALRRAESVAVLDAEVQASMFRVSQAVKEADGTVDDPKSEAGKRDMPVLPRLWGKVGEMRAWKRARGLADALPLACNYKGGVIRPQNLYRWWKRITVGTDFEDVGLHQIRHSNLSHVARRMSAYDLMRYARDGARSSPRAPTSTTTTRRCRDATTRRSAWREATRSGSPRRASPGTKLAHPIRFRCFPPYAKCDKTGDYRIWLFPTFPQVIAFSSTSGVRIPYAAP